MRNRAVQVFEDPQQYDRVPRSRWHRIVIEVKRLGRVVQWCEVGSSIATAMLDQAPKGAVAGADLQHPRTVPNETSGNASPLRPTQLVARFRAPSLERRPGSSSEVGTIGGELRWP